MWKVCRRAVAWWVGAVALCVWCGCTVTKTNYATLSFFFDGVPEPSVPGAGGTGPAGDTTLSVSVVVHKPFGEQNCEACHKTQYRPSRNDPSVCLSCHDKVMNQHQWTHGAVAGGACVWCHSPHEAARSYLLRGPDRKLCMQCHSATMMNGSTVPAHADPKSGCLDCHFGHGGKDSLMLRPGATAQGPATQSPEPAKPPSDMPEPPAASPTNTESAAVNNVAPK